jgi:hypothetical protein
LPQVLVWRHDANLLDLVEKAAGASSEPVVRLVFLHRPHGDADCSHRLFDRVELGAQFGRDALVALVVREEIVAKGADGVVECHGHVRD